MLVLWALKSCAYACLSPVAFHICTFCYCVYVRTGRDLTLNYSCDCKECAYSHAAMAYSLYSCVFLNPLEWMTDIWLRSDRHGFAMWWKISALNHSTFKKLTTCLRTVWFDSPVLHTVLVPWDKSDLNFSKFVPCCSASVFTVIGEVQSGDLILWMAMKSATQLTFTTKQNKTVRLSIFKIKKQLPEERLC